MLLHALCRNDRSVLTVSPVLLGFAALPGTGLLLLPVFAIAAAQPGGGALWFLFGFCAFFFGVGTYAFGKAAWAKQVRCRREGPWLEVLARGQRVQLAADTAYLLVRARSFCHVRPVTVHMVVLGAPGAKDEYVLHAGLLSGGAHRAGERLAAHLDLSLR